MNNIVSNTLIGIALALAAVSYVTSTKSEDVCIKQAESIKGYLESQVALSDSQTTVVERQNQMENNINNIAKYLIQAEKAAKEQVDAKAKNK